MRLIGQQAKLTKHLPPSVKAERAMRREQRKRLRAATRSGPSGLMLTLALKTA